MAVCVLAGILADRSRRSLTAQPLICAYFGLGSQDFYVRLLGCDVLNAGALEQTVAAASPVVALVYEKPARHTRPSYIYASLG